jgi:hypothetical protein
MWHQKEKRKSLKREKKKNRTSAHGYIEDADDEMMKAEEEEAEIQRVQDH